MKHQLSTGPSYTTLVKIVTPIKVSMISGKKYHQKATQRSEKAKITTITYASIWATTSCHNQNHQITLSE